MSRTLQDPESYVGLKSKIETACPWAPSADPMTIYIYINRKCSAITAMPQLCPEGVSPVRYWMLRAALRQWAMCWMLLFSRETNPGWAHTGTNISEPPQEQVVVMGRRVVQPEAWSVPPAGCSGSGPSNWASHRNCQGHVWVAEANQFLLIYSKHQFFPENCIPARIFCDQQPNEFLIHVSLRLRRHKGCVAALTWGRHGYCNSHFPVSHFIYCTLNQVVVIKCSAHLWHSVNKNIKKIKRRLWKASVLLT